MAYRRKHYRKHTYSSSLRYHKRWYNYWWNRYLKKREKKCIQRFNYHSDCYIYTRKRHKVLNKKQRRYLWQHTWKAS